MELSTLRRASFRAVLAWCLLSVTGYLFVRPIMTAFLPMMQIIIDAMQSNYVSHLSMIEMQGTPQILMSCTATRPFFYPSGQAIPLFATVNCAYTGAVDALVPIVIFLVAVVGWPMGSRVERRRRLLASLLMLPCVVALTIPIALVGLEQMGRNPDAFSGAKGQLTALLQPFAVMEMGGRWLLPLAAALACIRLATPTSQRAPVSGGTQSFKGFRRKLARYYLRVFH